MFILNKTEKPKILRFAAFCMALVLLLPFFVFDASSAVTSAPTPTGEATLLFAKKLGTGYKNAPTPIACADDCIVLAAGRNLYKLDEKTGEILAEQEMESVSTYTAVPPLIAENKVFMPLDEGIVQAFALSNLQPIWTYTDPLGGQGLTPILYDDGYLFTGFWNGETDDANFVCLSAEGSGEQKAVWTFTSKGGFYRAAALAIGDYLVLGSENGERVNLPDAPSNIYAIDKKTGTLASSQPAPGDIRAGVGMDPESGALFTVTKAGYLLRFELNRANGMLTEPVKLQLAGSSTVTPLVHNGRLYAACSDSGSGLFLVMDASTLNVEYSASLPGAPQGDILLSDAYEKGLGRVLLYLTYNAPPGGVYLFEDAVGQKEAAALELFAPTDNMRQYCFCPVVSGKDGTLYYKNDSGNVFALRSSSQPSDGFSAVVLRIRQLFALFSRLMSFVNGWIGK